MDDFLPPQPGLQEAHDMQQQMLQGPGPGPRPPKPIGGCAGTRYGCCANNLTPKINAQGSNCRKFFTVYSYRSANNCTDFEKQENFLGKQSE